MILFYPSSESKTDHQSPPWATVALIVISLACWALILVPREQRYLEQRTQALSEVNKALTYQRQTGELDENLYIRSQRDPDVIDAWSNRVVFSEEVKEAYRRYQRIPLVLQAMERGPLQRMLLAFTPHHFSLALLGAFCLWLTGFLAEHRYGRRLPLGLFLLSAFSWIMIPVYFPGAVWAPSPIFAWANAAFAFLLTFWLTAPQAVVVMTFKIWLGRFHEFHLSVPLILLPLAFGAGLVALNLYFSDYSAYFAPLSLAGPAAEAVLFALGLALIAARRGPAPTAKELINQRIARAESLFNEQQSDEALEILRETLEQPISVEQARRVADLAWSHHATSVAEQGYRMVLKHAMQSHSVLDVIPLIEEMSFRGIIVPPRLLQSFAAMGVKQNYLVETRRLWAVMREHPEMESGELLRFCELLVDKEIQKKHPDRAFLLDTEAWLDQRFPAGASLLDKLRDHLRRGAERAEQSPYEKHKIHRVIDAELLNIGVSKIRLQPRDAPPQNVPWTAALGFFGCHVAAPESRGYRGCILIRFKRRVYACQFDAARVKMTDDIGAPLSFESVWTLLKEHAPEDLPFHELDAFEQIEDPEQFSEKLQAFVDEHRI